MAASAWLPAPDCEGEHASACTIEALPHGALVHVLGFLGVQDLLQAAGVCRAWRAASKHDALWETLAAELQAASPSLLHPLQAVRHHYTAQIWSAGTPTSFLGGAARASRSTAPQCCWSRKGGRNAAPPAAAAAAALYVAVEAGDGFSLLLAATGEVHDSRAPQLHGASAAEDAQQLQPPPAAEGATVSSSSRQLEMPLLWRPPCGARVAAVAAGGSHALVVTSSGEVWGWGANSAGQLGLGLTSDWVASPACVTQVLLGDWLVPGDVVTRVACGTSHSALGCDSGRLYLAGANSSGECGVDPEQDQAKHLVLFTAPEGQPGAIVHNACGHANTAAVTSDGRVWVCGDNANGQCGPNCTTAATPSFTLVGPSAAWHGMARTGQAAGGGGGTAGARVTQVTCGRGTMYALTDQGELFAWGQGSQGELGTGGATRSCSTPGKLTWSKEVVAVNASCSGRFAAAVDSAGRLFTWGAGKYGQLGHGDTHKRTVGRQVKAVAGEVVLDVACGSEQLLVLTTWRPPRSSTSTSTSSGSGSHGVDTVKGSANRFAGPSKGAAAAVAGSPGGNAGTAAGTTTVLGSSPGGNRGGKGTCTISSPPVNSSSSSFLAGTRPFSKPIAVAASSSRWHQGSTEEDAGPVGSSYGSSYGSSGGAAGEEGVASWTSVGRGRKSLSRAAAVAAASKVAAQVTALQLEDASAADDGAAAGGRGTRKQRQAADGGSDTAAAAAAAGRASSSRAPSTRSAAADAAVCAVDQQQGVGTLGAGDTDTSWADQQQQQHVGRQRGRKAQRRAQRELQEEMEEAARTPWAGRRCQWHLDQEMAAAAASSGGGGTGIPRWRDFTRPMDTGFRGTLKRLLKAFANDPAQRELELPTSLSAADRYKVHVVADAWGLAHESYGAEPHRYIKVWKVSRRRPAARNQEQLEAAPGVHGSSSSGSSSSSGGPVPSVHSHVTGEP